MSKHQKSSRNAALRQLRRRGLAAIVIAWGTLGLVAADERPQKSEISLRLLPPLPVGIGQLSGSPEGPHGNVEAKSVGTARLRSNPYAVSSPTAQESKTTQAPIIRQVGIVQADAVNRSVGTQTTEPSARLVKQPETTFALRPVAMPNQSDLVASKTIIEIAPAKVANIAPIEALEGEPQPAKMMLSKIQENPWVSQTESTDNTSIIQEASVPGAQPTWAQPEVEHASVTTSAHFSLTDKSGNDQGFIVAASSADGDVSLRLNDAGLTTDSASAGVAPLLRVAAPTLLQVAEPVSFQEEKLESSDSIESPDSMIETRSDRQARDGDVRSATGRLSWGEQADEPTTQNAPDQVVKSKAPTSGIVVVEGVHASAIVEPQGAPAIIEVPEVLNAAKTDHDFSVDKLEASSDPRNNTPVAEVPRSQVPVPQVYRPKNSLVIDVPATKVSRTEEVSKEDKAPVNDESKSVFDGAASEVIPVIVAQTQAFTPSDAVRRVQLENRDVCEAVLVGSHKLLLIGRSEGVTKLAVWCGADTQARLFDVQVVTGRDATPGTSMDSIASRLTETIAATYPNCQVRVVPDGEGLAVVGIAGDAKSAREILRLVRSACLKSVSDQLEVR